MDQAPKIYSPEEIREAKSVILGALSAYKERAKAINSSFFSGPELDEATKLSDQRIEKALKILGIKL